MKILTRTIARIRDKLWRVKQTIHILYISGFGDRYDSLRLKLLKKWRFKGVTVELVPMKWQTGTFEQKIAQIDRAIDRAKKGDVIKRIVIIGESAGGSMAIHMYARRGDDVYKVMTLCGKNTHPETVAESYYENHPSFMGSMQQLNASLEQLTNKQRREFVSIHPLYDPTVSVRDTLLPGCRQVRLPIVGHLFAIMLALTIFSPLVIHVVRR